MPGFDFLLLTLQDEHTSRIGFKLMGEGVQVWSSYDEYGSCGCLCDGRRRLSGEGTRGEPSSMIGGGRVANALSVEFVRGMRALARDCFEPSRS